MGVFKKTIKYSKPSQQIDEKLRLFDQELKKTGVIEGTDNLNFLRPEENEIKEEIKIYDNLPIQNEERLYNWRENFLGDETENQEIEYKQEEKHNIIKVENYISQNNIELIEIRDKVFAEISKSTLLDLPDIKAKISKVLEIYDQIQEGLLNEPPDVKNSDPLTPLDQNFVTIDELNNHYKLFINRIQQQLSTMGGGGETRLEFLDDIDRNSAKVNGRFLKYDSASGKWIGALGGGGGSQTLDDTLQLGNISSLGMSVGVITATYFVGDGSLLTNVPGSNNSGYANIAGIATYANIAGIATYANSSGISTVSQGLTGIPNINVGIVTATVANITGNVTLGASSSNLINVPGRISSNFYPDGDGLYDVGRAPQIGSGANRWKDANFLGKGTFDGGVDAHDLELGVSSANLIYSTSGNLELNSQSGTTNIDDIVTISGNTGIGTVNPLTPLQVERYGVKTGFGTFIASAGVTTDIDSFVISTNDFKTAEYTVHIQSPSSIQTQKVLVMQNGTSAFSEEYAIMYEPTFVVSIGATVSGGSCKLQFTPDTGVSGLVTYRFTRGTMI